MKKNKSMPLMLSASISVSAILSAMPVLPVQADSGSAYANISEDRIVIGNENIERELSITDGNVQTTALVNKKINRTLSPQEESEDFVIHSLKPQESETDPEEPSEPAEPYIPDALDRTSWTGTITNASGTTFPEGDFEKLTDGDLNTYIDRYNITTNPFTVEADLGEEQTIAAFSVNKRPGYPHSSYGLNGTIGDYEFFVSNDKTNWTSAGSGSITKEDWNLHEENGNYNVGDTVYVNLDEPVSGRYIRLVQKSCSLGGAQEFSMAELNLYGEKVILPEPDEEPEPEVLEGDIKSSDLTLENVSQEKSEDSLKVTVDYEPVTVNETTWDISQVFVVGEDTDYMRMFLEIKNDDPSNTIIDYIDQDAFVLPDTDMDTVWEYPDESQINTNAPKAYEFMLGQPVYADGMYLGSEFPASDNRVNENRIQVRYYSGKTFDKLAEDNQLTTDGKFVSWQSVTGSARGLSEAEVQTDFYRYIEDIATPTEFRRQYNSWYDNMIAITDESIEKSFTEVEAGLADWGVEPLDAYVVDDGWNNYYDGTYLTTPGETQGTSPNRTGFWETNDKFPNEFYTSSSLASKLNSTFGIWIGPQGGYSYFSPFSQMLEAWGTGYSQIDGAWGAGGRNVCVGSRRYIRNYANFASDHQERFGVEYWKWDGFAAAPCTNPEHDHMTGGYHNMYYTSDMWEAWIDLFEQVRAVNEKNGKGLFINATCFVNPSPWLLQWVNTVWLQESGDTGQTNGAGERHQRKIYYRDNVYNKLLRTIDLQFPLNNYYNHDPIYGVSDGSNASDAVFREYLMANAMRGTAFWELYYSPSMINEEKFAITADVLEWAENNHDILKNAKLFGGNPATEVYGYACWNGDQGIISFTNPTGESASYDLVIDEQIGADDSVANLSGIQALPYQAGELDETLSFGDTFHVELGANETKIFQFGSASQNEPVIRQSLNEDGEALSIRFDQRVWPVSATINDEEAELSLKEDYHTLQVRAADEIVEDATANLVYQDAWGNQYTQTIFVPHTSNSLLDAAADEAVLNTEATYDTKSGVLWLENPDQVTLKDSLSIPESQPFTLETSFATTDSSVTLLNTDQNLSLSIDENGFLNFNFGQTSLSSREETTEVVEKAHGTYGTDEYVPSSLKQVIKGQVNDGEEHSAAVIRENNGTLKLFVDGHLVASCYGADVLTLAQNEASVEIGQENWTGKMTPPVIHAKALAPSRLQTSEEKNWEDVLLDRSNWTPEACTEETNATGDTYASGAIDGNTSTFWHTNWHGKDHCAMGEHYLKLTFGKEEAFDSLTYLCRGADQNGSIKDFRLDLLDENGEVFDSIEGTFAPETKDTIRFGKVIKAYGVTLVPLSTQNGNNYAAATELEFTIASKELSEEQISELKAKVQEEKENFDASSYSDATADNVLKAIHQLKSATNINDLSWNAAQSKLEEAKNALVNVTSLREVLTRAEDKAAEDNNPAAALTRSIDHAKAAMQFATKQSTVDHAAEALEKAIEGATIPVESLKTLLKNSVDYARNILDNEDLSSLNGIVKNYFDQAYETACQVLEDEIATEKEVKDAWKNLTYAIHLLSFTADKTSLQDLVNEAEAIHLEDAIPGEALDEFHAALDHAKSILNSETALDDSIQEAHSRLASAMAGLSFKEIDTRMLVWLIQTVENEDLSVFVPNGIDEFKSALEQAKAVAADPASQSEVDAAADALNDAWINLRRKPDESVLETLRSFTVFAASLDEDLYEPQAIAKVRALSVRIETALNDPNLDDQTSKDLAAQAEDLKSALRPAEEGKTPSEKPDAEPSTKPADQPSDSTANQEQKETAKSVKTASQSSLAAYFSGLAIAALGLLSLKKRRK